MSAATAAAEVKARARIRKGYYLKDGTRVPSVTTMLAVIAKPALLAWHNRMGLEGIDTSKFVNSLAIIGTLAHAMATAYLRGESPEAECAGYDKATIDLAENCFLSFLSWAKDRDIKPVLMEVPMVSETFRYGGKFDFYGTIDGRLTVADFKTGSGIWPEHFHQLAAYGHLLVENGHDKPMDYLVINIPRAASESFDTKTRTDVSDDWEMFKLAMGMYRLQSKIKKA
jgi:hypothetical protein